MKPVYYNEIDLHAAQWLRNLIAAGHIADGVVDTRSIEDVQPDDLREFTQCHFFAGIGVWSYALRRAGWPDDRPVWTGSCPCQPFSAAGEGLAFADERHLWPAMFHLLSEHVKWLRQQKRPLPAVLGEQVASKDADTWIDLVQADMEALGYSFGAVAFPSASVGAPHIRDRTYWGGVVGVGQADTNNAGLEGRSGMRKRTAQLTTRARGVADGMAHANGRNAGAERQQRRGEQRQQPEDNLIMRLADACGERLEGVGLLVQPGQPRQADAEIGRNGEVGRMADTDSGAGGQGSPLGGGRHQGGDAQPRPGLGGNGVTRIERPGPTNGFWRDADWLGCTDGKWRPVMPGTFPLASRAPARVGRLRAYGNAINAEAARVWIECVMETAA